MQLVMFDMAKKRACLHQEQRAISLRINTLIRRQIGGLFAVRCSLLAIRLSVQFGFFLFLPFVEPNASHIN